VYVQDQNHVMSQRRILWPSNVPFPSLAGHLIPSKRHIGSVRRRSAIDTLRVNQGQHNHLVMKQEEAVLTTFPDSNAFATLIARLISFVYTEANNPYSVALAFSIASSSVLNVLMFTNGPNTS